MQTIKLAGKPKHVGEKFTVDIEVEETHSYTIATKSCRGVVSHNSVSLLAGSTPGIHFPKSQYYVRRVRLMNQSELLPALRAAGYKIEPCVGSEKSTVVVEFPIALEPGIRISSDVSVWEKVQLASFIQKWWADNQVSVTIDFDPNTEANQIKHVLEYAQYGLKAISLLPSADGVYAQMPYEAITKEQFEVMSAGIKPLVFDKSTTKSEEKETDMFCDGDKCEIRSSLRSP